MSDEKVAWALGYAGLLPFVACLLLATLGGEHAQVLGQRGFLAYSAVILSFLGGVRWGAAMSMPNARQFTLAVAPSVIAFLLLLLPLVYALPLLALMFAVLGLFDVLRPRSPLWPMWYRSLRIHLTIGVVVLHLILLGLSS